MNKSLDTLLSDIKKNIENKTVNTNQDKKRSLEKNSVTKSNALTRAYYRFGLVEKRCMESLISKLNPMRQDNLQDIELRAIDYANAFGVSEKHAYEHLSKAVDALLNRIIIVPETPNKIVKMTLTARAVYEKNAGNITVTFNPLIVPHLMGLKAKFSSYPLKVTANFSSSYTWRMYELLVSWAQPKKKTNGIFVGWFTVEVDELRKMFGVPESYSWNMFQRRVINKALSELKEKANIQIDITRIKTSRKITHLNIEFIENKQENS